MNSFKFTNEKDAITIGRYQLIPEAGRHFLSKDESAKAAPDYLEDEIRQRVARGLVRFKVVLQLAAPGDKIDDPSVTWANTNKITTLGTLTVASVVPDLFEVDAMNDSSSSGDSGEGERILGFFLRPPSG